MKTMDFTGTFANEKRFQAVFGLKNRPERFTKRENVLSSIRHSVIPQMIVIVDENPDGFIPGYYLMTPADASRLEKQTDGLFEIRSQYSI